MSDRTIGFPSITTGGGQPNIAPSRRGFAEASVHLEFPAVVAARFLLAGMRIGRPLAMLNGLMALGALIVDDNPDYLSASSELLESQGMRVVAVASTSAEALRCLRESPADVVLIDVDLGDESGFELARTLHGGDELEAPPVIMISAYAEDDVVELLDSSPAIGFLSKSSLSASAIETLLRGRR